MTNPSPVVVIAEAGVNHNGSLEQAKALVDAAKEAGADIVKFQTFRAENLVTKNAAKAAYQKERTGTSETQFEMLKKLELSFDDFLFLADYCDKKRIEFLSTAFDEECLEFLIQKTGIKRIKIPSGELTNGPLLAASARANLPLIVSTGMATIAEIESALDVIVWARSGESYTPERIKARFKNSDRTSHSISLLHCTTEYPAPFADLNLRAIQSIETTFDLPTGYSDHSEGIIASIAAVAMGASIVEKHFTLSKDLPGPDHKASLDAAELKTMVQQIRWVETMLGTGFKAPSARELENALVARKSLAALRQIEAGEPLTFQNMTTKRPGHGISGMNYWKLLGQRTTKNYSPDDLITEALDK